MVINLSTLGLIVGIIGTAFGIYMGFYTRRKGDSNDIKQDAKGDAELRADIKYIARGVEDIRVDMKAQEKRHGDLTERVTRVEESAKSAHKRLDSIEGS